MGIVVAVVFIMTACTSSLVETDSGDPPPILLLPSWGDLPGGRIVLPDGTAAVTFPDDWGAVALTEERKADVLAADPNAEEGMGLSQMQMMAETKGGAQESCVLSVVPMAPDDVAGKLVRSVASGMMRSEEYMHVRVAEVLLPAGLATRIRWRQVVENPERFDGPREMYADMFGVGHEGRLYMLVCYGLEPPTGQWESIAESIEWLGPQVKPQVKPPA